MKYILTLLLLLFTISLSAQVDSTLIVDRQQIDKNLQTTQNQITKLTTETNQLEGVIGYVQTLDSSLQKTKNDYTYFVDQYSKLKAQLVEAQIQLYILQGLHTIYFLELQVKV